MFVEVVFKSNGKLAKVYDTEANSLISKGLACWPGEYVKTEEIKELKPEYQTKVIEAPKNKRGRHAKN